MATPPPPPSPRPAACMTDSRGHRPRETSAQPHFECLIFDMDDTLYPPSNGLMEASRNRIAGYLRERLRLDTISSAHDLSEELYRAYGSTLAGLVALGFRCDFQEYHRYVHGELPYHNLKRDDYLRKLLLSLPQRKVVFTNGDKGHAYRTLERLGITDCFEQIVTFENLNLRNNFGCSSSIVCKPLPEAFHRGLSILGVVDPSQALLFDDSPKNIDAAKAIGLWTCLVGGRSKKAKGADYVVDSIHDIGEVIPVLSSTQKIHEKPDV